MTFICYHRENLIEILGEGGYGMTLADIKKGEKFNITHINDDKIRVQALRFGISEGANLLCEEKIPGGPVIVKKRFQEIAIGRNLANNILIELG